jgi:hypothetical protein
MNEAELTAPAPPGPALREPDRPPEPPRSAPSLASVLARLRRRASRVEALRWAALGLAAAAGGLLASVGLLVLRQQWARPGGWFVAALALGAGIAGAFVAARRVRRDDRRAAVALGRVAPALLSDLVSAVELEREPGDGSPALARAHRARMDAIAGGLDAAGAVPWRPALLALGALGATLAGHGLLHRLGGERVREAYAYLAFHAPPETQLFAVEPIAGDVTLTYRYPAHMARAPRTVAGTAGDIHAPKGTVVEITAHADRDLARAFLVLGSGSLPLAVAGRDVSGSLVVSGPGDWRFRWAGPDGASLAEGPPRPIVVEPDAFPTVKLTAPGAEKEIDGRELLTLGLEAGDDYGIGELELVFSKGRGAAEERRPLATLTERPRRHRAEWGWDLAPLDLKPGDRVTYRVEVLDNDAVSGPKRGVSATQVLKVFSLTEHHEEILRRAEEQWERLLSGLGDRLEERGPGDQGERADAAWAQATGEKDQLLTRVAMDLGALGRELAKDKRAPPEIGRALLHVGNRVASSVERTIAGRAALVRRPSPPAARQHAKTLSTEIAEEERGALYLENLIDRQKLLDLAEMARELQQGRQELSRLVEQFRKAPNDETKRRIQAEVARLKERMSALFKRMQELAKGLQDSHLNQEAEDLLDEGDDMMSQLDEIQKALNSGDSDKALEALEELQKSLEKMEKEFNEQAGETDPEAERIGRELQKLASDLLDVEAEQRSVKEQTEQLRQQKKAEMEQQLRKLGKAFVEKQRARVQRANEELERVSPELAEALAEDEQLQSARERLAQLDQALQGSDFDEALEQAERAQQNAQGMKNRLTVERDAARQFPGLVRDPAALEQAAGRVERAEDEVRGVTEDLDKLLRSARQPPGPAEREKLQQLAQKQQGLQKQTERLQERLDGLGEQMPLFGPQQGKLLRDAAQQMGEAKGKLGQSDARGAGSKQGEALQKLEALKQAMQQGQNQGQGQGGRPGVPMPFGPSGGQEGDGGEEGDGGQFRGQKVEIPSADESRAPAEFRRDILDAMKDRPPREFEPQVRDYYEELVK